MLRGNEIINYKEYLLYCVLLSSFFFPRFFGITEHFLLAMFLHFSALLFCIEIILITKVSPQGNVGAESSIK